MIGTPDGVRRADEEHRLALVTPAQMMANFAKAGLDVTHDPIGPAKRGLFVGRVTAQ